MGILILAVVGIFVFSFLGGVTEGFGGTGGFFYFLGAVSFIVAMVYVVKISLLML